MLKRSGLFRDEPEIMRSLMDKDVPLALAMRGFDAYYATKVRETNKKIREAGFSSTEDNIADPKKPSRDDGGFANADTYQERLDALNRQAEANRPDDTSGPFGWLADRILDVGQVAKTVGEGIASGATWLWNRTVGAPMAAGYASDVNDTSGGTSLFGRIKGLEGAIRQTEPNIPVVSNVLHGAGQVIEAPFNVAEGAYRITSGEVSDAHRGRGRCTSVPGPPARPR